MCSTNTLPLSVADLGGATGAYAPPAKIKFLAIIEGFWPIEVFLCVSYCWERPSHLLQCEHELLRPVYNQGFV